MFNLFVCDARLKCITNIKEMKFKLLEDPFVVMRAIIRQRLKKKKKKKKKKRNQLS